jgi:hypothetical protein
MQPHLSAGESDAIELRHAQLNFGDKLIANEVEGRGTFRDYGPHQALKRDRKRMLRSLIKVALAPTLATAKIDLLLAQRTPYVLHVDVAERLSDQWCVPTRISFRRRLVQDCANALVGRGP